LFFIFSEDVSEDLAGFPKGRVAVDAVKDIWHEVFGSLGCFFKGLKVVLCAGVVSFCAEFLQAFDLSFFAFFIHFEDGDGGFLV